MHISKLYTYIKTIYIYFYN